MCIMCAAAWTWTMTDSKPTTNEWLTTIPKADFHKHLKDTAQKVSEMPAWKRNVIKGREKMNTNKQIALLRKWRCINGWWFPPDGDTRSTGHPHIPDFEHDWAHAGPLLEEMCEADMLEEGPPGRRSDGKDPLPGWYIPWYCNEASQSYESVGDSLPQAISCAWLAWKKEE